MAVNVDTSRVPRFGPGASGAARSVRAGCLIPPVLLAVRVLPPAVHLPAVHPRAVPHRLPVPPVLQAVWGEKMSFKNTIAVLFMLATPILSSCIRECKCTSTSVWNSGMLTNQRKESVRVRGKEIRAGITYAEHVSILGEPTTIVSNQKEPDVGMNVVYTIEGIYYMFFFVGKDRLLDSIDVEAGF